MESQQPPREFSVQRELTPQQGRIRDYLMMHYLTPKFVDSPVDEAMRGTMNTQVDDLARVISKGYDGMTDKEREDAGGKLAEVLMTGFFTIMGKDMDITARLAKRGQYPGDMDIELGRTTASGEFQTIGGIDIKAWKSDTQPEVRGLEDYSDDEAQMIVDNPQRAAEIELAEDVVFASSQKDVDAQAELQKSLHPGFPIVILRTDASKLGVKELIDELATSPAESPSPEEFMQHLLVTNVDTLDEALENISPRLKLALISAEMSHPQEVKDAVAYFGEIDKSIETMRPYQEYLLSSNKELTPLQIGIRDWLLEAYQRPKDIFRLYDMTLRQSTGFNPTSMAKKISLGWEGLTRRERGQVSGQLVERLFVEMLNEFGKGTGVLASLSLGVHDETLEEYSGFDIELRQMPAPGSSDIPWTFMGLDLKGMMASDEKLAKKVQNVPNVTDRYSHALVSPPEPGAPGAEEQLVQRLLEGIEHERAYPVTALRVGAAALGAEALVRHLAQGGYTTKPGEFVQRLLATDQGVYDELQRIVVEGFPAMRLVEDSEDLRQGAEAARKYFAVVQERIKALPRPQG